MKRETNKNYKTDKYYLNCNPECKEKCESCKKLISAISRLAEIEDILGEEYDIDRLRGLVKACKGLDPEEIDECKFMIATRKDPEKISRLRELVQADKDGGCEIFPCKVGDIVYVVNRGDYYSRYEPYISEKEIIEINWRKDRSGKDLGFGLILKGGNYNTSARYKILSIGKTVFLTREEAEVALKERKKDE